MHEEIQSAAPSRRVNASFTACGDYLWLIGGGKVDGTSHTIISSADRIRIQSTLTVGRRPSSPSDDTHAAAA